MSSIPSSNYFRAQIYTDSEGAGSVRHSNRAYSESTEPFARFSPDTFVEDGRQFRILARMVDSGDNN